MITEALIKRIYGAANIQRWNDHARPVEFTEIDKQAHKLIIAWVLGKFEEDAGKERVDWMKLIEGGIFEFLHRITLTDIKPAVFHEMMSKKGDELNRWVISTLDPELRGIGGDFLGKFNKYLFDPSYARREKRILKAAHYIATNWEFRILYQVNSTLYGIDKTKEDIENQIEDHYDLIGVQKIMLGKKSHGFIDLCGQLRYQQRWAQTPRIPKTSVLGHMFIVALLAYFIAREAKLCDKRVTADFFSALFHDLPEVLTRDIISPIKSSIPGLDDIIKTYEKKQIDEKILPLLPAAWSTEMRCFIENEFCNKVVKNGITCVVEDGDIPEDCSSEDFFAVDGRLIEACDKYAAYVEAALSIQYGVTSKELVAGKQGLADRFAGRTVAGFDFGQLFTYFS